MRLHEIRVFRAIYRQPKDLAGVKVTEWTMSGRAVKDYEYFGSSEGARHVVAATIGPDPAGKALRVLGRYLETTEFDAAILEGPREVAWEVLEGWAAKSGWKVAKVEFLTTEMGEALVRRRVGCILHQSALSEDEINSRLVRSVTPASIGSCLGPSSQAKWLEVERYEPALGAGEDAMLAILGGHAWLEKGAERLNVYRTSGPCRWPLTRCEGRELEPLLVMDKSAPVGKVRQLSEQEIWVAQGRSVEEFRTLALSLGEAEVAREGSRATGRRTALALLGLGAEVLQDWEGGNVPRRGGRGQPSTAAGVASRVAAGRLPALRGGSKGRREGWRAGLAVG